MKERPILFSGPMVRALLDGRKTQTRRVVKLRGDAEFDGFTPDGLVLASTANEPTGTRKILCPYGIPGDRLWVRETWKQESYSGRALNTSSPTHEVTLAYRAGGGTTLRRPERTDLMRGVRWKPSIHMPRWASRLTLEVTGVRVERVQDISEADARAEGLSMLTKDGGRTWKFGVPDRDGLPGTDNDGWEWRDWCVDARASYRRLWSDINGPDSWNANPWVWVLDFTTAERRGEG